MGRPGRLRLRNAVKGSGGQISLNNLLAENTAFKLAQKLKSKEEKKKKISRKPIFGTDGHVTLQSISERREFFLGKSIARLEHELHRYGYITQRKKSNREGSKAKITIVINSSKGRNIGQIQVSPGSKRHGDVPYVKISTKDIGKIKIIDSTKEKYKTDGKEKAELLFRRYF